MHRSAIKNFYYINLINDSTGYCRLDCISVTQFFDQIEDLIHTIDNKEIKDELFYDFKLAWDNIFQLMAHRIRAAQQEQEKQKYLKEMDETTAFLTIDWSQKILPQQFREGQSSYFGKKGMSLLVGSFILKLPSESKKKIRTDVENIFMLINIAEIISKTYMLAFTKCSQTEYETLSGGQLILQQFHKDFPHM